MQAHDLEPRRQVRAVYEAVRAGRSKRVEIRRSPAAAIEELLGGAANGGTPGAGEDAAAGARGLMGAWTPAAVPHALALVGRPFASGSLFVSDGRQDLAVLFAPAGVRAVSLGRPFPSLAARLFDREQLDAARMHEATRRVAEGQARGEAEALLGLGVGADALADATAELIGQALLDALFWDAPMFEAVPVDRPDVLERRDTSVLALGARGLVRRLVASVGERAESLAQVVRTVPSPATRLALGERAGAISSRLDPRQLHVVEVVGVRPDLTLAELELELAQAGFRAPRHVVAADCHELVARQVLAAKPGEVAHDAAGAPPVDDGLDPLPRSLRWAKRSVETGDRRAATRHLCRAGALLLEQGRSDEAVAALQAAGAITPQDLEAHDGLVKALVAADRREEAAAESEELARRYLDAHLPGRARRALGRADPSQTALGPALLALEATLALGERRAAAVLGQRLAGELREQGRRGEAQAIERVLELEADDEALVPEARAGAPRLVLAAAGVAALALGGALVLARGRLEARRAFAAASEGARRTLAATPLATDGLAARFTAPALRTADVEASARAAEEELARLDDDRRALEALVVDLRAARDVEAGVRRAAEVRPRGPALAAPLERLGRALRARLEAAERAFTELAALRARGAAEEALARAKRLLVEFPDAPGLLARAAVPIEVTSDPPGGTVLWGGTTIPQATPLRAELPLLEEREVVVSLRGHESVRRVLRVEALDSTRVVVRLAPARGPR